MQALPDDVLGLIFEKVVGSVDIWAIAKLCKKFYQVISSDRVCKEIYIETFQKENCWNEGFTALERLINDNELEHFLRCHDLEDIWRIGDRRVRELPELHNPIIDPEPIPYSADYDPTLIDRINSKIPFTIQYNQERRKIRETLVPPPILSQVIQWKEMIKKTKQMKSLWNQSSKSTKVIHVLLAGPANSGKSTILHKLLEIPSNISSTCINNAPYGPGLCNIARIETNDNRDLRICEIRRPHLWQPELYGSNVRHVIWVIDNSISYSNTQLNEMYYQLHTTIGEAFMKSVHLLVLINKEGKMTGKQWSDFLRLSAMKTCMWYNFCRAELMELKTMSLEEIVKIREWLID